MDTHGSGRWQEPPGEVDTRVDEQETMLDLPGFSDDLFDMGEGPASPAHRPWWRHWWMAAVAAVLAVALILGGVAVVRARNPKVTYATATVTTGTITNAVSATGPIQSAEYDVNFSGSGKIAQINVTTGQQVKAGQVLAKLDPTSLQDALNSAQASVNSAQTSLNNANASYTRTQVQTQASVNQAYAQEQLALSKCASGDTNCVNAAETQYASAQAQAQSQLNSAQAQINSAQAQLKSAQAQLTTAQHNLANATITAPHAGVVAAINGVVGGSPGSGGSGTSSAGSTSGSGGSSGAFIQILDLSSLQVVADVNESDISKVANGQHVTFSVSAYTGRTFAGTVSAISPLGQSSQSVVTYPVTINVDTSNLNGVHLLPGMTATVSIVTAQHANVLRIPASAVTFARQEIASGAIPRTQAVAALRQAATMFRDARASDPNATSDGLAAGFVLERANNAWVVKPVVTGLSDGTFIEVVSGLQQGETIVTSQSGGTQATTTTGTTIPAGGRFFGGGGGGFGGGGFGGGRGGAGGAGGARGTGGGNGG